MSIISQALIFVTRSRSWSYFERPGIMLCVAFICAQLVSFFIQNNFFFIFLVFNVKIQIGFNQESVLNLLGCHCHCCVCTLGLCKNQWSWMEMGWCNLDLQHYYLYSSWHPQVFNPHGTHRQCLGQHAPKQGLEVLNWYLIFLFFLIYDILLWKKKTETHQVLKFNSDMWTLFCSELVLDESYLMLTTEGSTCVIWLTTYIHTFSLTFVLPFSYFHLILFLCLTSFFITLCLDGAI